MSQTAFTPGGNRTAHSSEQKPALPAATTHMMAANESRNGLFIVCSRIDFARPFDALYHPDGTCNIRTPRGKDRRQLGRTAPPRTTYWLLAEPGRCYLAYARGLADELKLKLGPNAEGEYRARLYDPRSGSIQPVGGRHELKDTFTWTPPDSDDWVLHLARTDSRQ